MEKELYKLGHNMRIMEEVRPIDYEQTLTINGKEVTIGKGNQHILHLAINDKSSAQISFFASPEEKPEVIDGLRKTFLNTLCSYFIKPLSNLQKELNSNVAIQA